VDAQWLEPGAVREIEPMIQPDLRGALFIPAHGAVRVSSLLGALVDSARLRGAVFESPVEAATVTSGRDAVSVRVGDDRREADMVVVATGSWSKRVRIENIPALPVRPVRGQLLQLRWADDRPPRRVLWGPRCYAVPWSDGTLLVGATAEEVGFNESATVAGVRRLTSAVVDLLPSAAMAAFEAVRVGLRPALPDGLPAIGPISRAPRVVVATGHFRNGILLAPLTASLVSRFVLDGLVDDAFATTTPDRFLT
jgi:glycine oxidase